MTRSDKVLLATHSLLDLPGITTELPHGKIGYFHVLLPVHAVLMANGAPAESLYLGPEAQKALSPAALAELAQRFPDQPWLTLPPAPACPLLTSRRAQRLVARHRKNQLPLVA